MDHWWWSSQLSLNKNERAGWLQKWFGEREQRLEGRWRSELWRSHFPNERMIDEFKLWTMQHLFIVISTTKYHSSLEFLWVWSSFANQFKDLIDFFVCVFICNLIGLSYVLLLFCAGFVLDWMCSPAFVSKCILPNHVVLHFVRRSWLVPYLFSGRAGNFCLGG